MAKALEPNKAKTARRVIEVLEFFNENNRRATVMDIVRRYQRPQSSTSELLASLVEMGLLYKDAATKSYTLTPRAAILGSLSQPSLVRDGKLLALADQLRAETGLSVAVVGLVGLNAQVFLWKAAGKDCARALGDFCSGQQQRLCDTAAGWLLLSSLPQQRYDGMLRRLNAEAPMERKFSHAAMSERVKHCAHSGSAEGPAGFVSAANMCAVLLRSEPSDRPLAICFIYEQGNRDASALIATLQDAVRDCISASAPELTQGVYGSVTRELSPTRDFSSPQAARPCSANILAMSPDVTTRGSSPGSNGVAPP
jgi:DNA-binding IclR family transcriptional regulator